MAASLPMFGTIRAKIIAVSPVSIHGDLYFDATIEYAHQQPGEPATVARVRIPQHACEREPRAGEMVQLSFLMQQITEVQFLS